MIRLLLYLVLGWVIYYAISGLLGSAKDTVRRARGGAGEEDADDVMQLCPECGTYFPSRMGVSRRAGGARYLFCGEDCAREFARRGGPPGEGG